MSGSGSMLYGGGGGNSFYGDGNGAFRGQVVVQVSRIVIYTTSIKLF